MAYSQPDSNIPNVQRAAFFRILQISTPGGGDIWESKIGGYAFCVGPNSDYANYELVWRDGQVLTTAMEHATFSADRPFVGLVQSHNESGGEYLVSGRPGRILFAPQDIFNDSPPPGFAVEDRRWFEYPVLDIFEYIAPQPVLPMSRPDKHKRYQELEMPSVTGGSFYLQTPYYGRKFASVLVKNRTGQEVTVQLIGMTFTTKTDDTSPIFVNIGSAITVADSANGSGQVNAASDGMFDYLVVQITPTDATGITNDISLDVYLSDNPA